MAQYSDLPVYKASYDMLVEMFVLIRNFGREYKYSVGDSLKKEGIAMITLIYRANSREDKAGALAEAREHIEVIRLLIRVMKDLHQYQIHAGNHWQLVAHLNLAMLLNQIGLLKQQEYPRYDQPSPKFYHLK